METGNLGLIMLPVNSSAKPELVLIHQLLEINQVSTVWNCGSAQLMKPNPEEVWNLFEMKYLKLVNLVTEICQ